MEDKDPRIVVLILIFFMLLGFTLGRLSALP